MKLTKNQKNRAILGLCAAVVLFTLWFFLLRGTGGHLSGATCGISAGLFGACAALLLTDYIYNKASPEAQKEMERTEQDERNRSIRLQAAYTSWYWTFGLLLVVYVILMGMNQFIPALMMTGVITLHGVFYLINVGRWSKKM